MPRGESLYHKYPDYRVDLEPSERRVTVRFNGETLVDTTNALVVRETNHDAVLYFPREDVRMELLERTDHETFCPFKGEASYWSLAAGGRREQNAAWSYEDPFDQVAGIKDYLAFYTDRVEWD
jgi:uncharacterized protein (DUF427 family)